MYGSAEWQPKKKERKKVIAFYRNRHRRHCLKCSRTEYTDALFQFSFFFFGHWRRDPAEASPAIREEEKAIRACLVCLPIFSPHFWVAGGAWLHRWYWMKCPWWGTTRRAHSWREPPGGEPVLASTTLGRGQLFLPSYCCSALLGYIFGSSSLQNWDTEALFIF